MTYSLHLMLLVGDVVPAPAPAVLVDALHSVRITTASGATNGFQLTFAVSAGSQLAGAVMPDGVLYAKKRVVVAVVLAGRCHVLMDGVITQQEMHAGRAPGSSFLVVTGEDLSLLMDLRHVRRAYPGLPPHLRASTVCAAYAQYGITPRSVAPVLTDQPNPVTDIPVQSATDLAYLRSMAADVGHVFHIEPGPVPGVSTAYWGPQNRAGALQPALTTGCGAADNVDELIFSFDGLATADYSTQRLEPPSTTACEVTAPETRLLRESLAASPARALRTAPLSGQTGRSLTRTLLAGLGREVAADPLTGRGTVDVLRYGHVLSVHGLVGVRGAGRAYDGRFFVAGVTHELTRDTYKQQFTLVRDGLGADTQAVTA
ncbi:hypothetical protein [Streptomyces atratus]|uniref:Phage protein D n=1 Tax=Streptomyces atratus TaxID=1893 RepID=A0A2Z5J5Y0_STRAR|nr:hypothetical protein [Streptomyces atratus]AXE75709.1 hypothetical protein C5746_00385 [Streptomyces atratus]AXE82457.1 hypothetical protein C5746_42850 [Streptomyces atratus]